MVANKTEGSKQILNTLKNAFNLFCSENSFDFVCSENENKIELQIKGLNAKEVFKV